MVKPTIAELSKDKYNRYTLVMAAAKGARYIINKENYEKEHPEYEQYKAITTGKKPEKEEEEEKPVKKAINMLYNDEILIQPTEELARADAEIEKEKKEAEEFLEHLTANDENK